MNTTYISLADLLTYTIMLTSVVAPCYKVFSDKNHKK